MALDIEKRKNTQIAESKDKSKGANTFLWILALVVIAAAAVGNIYFATRLATPIRIVGVIVTILIALGIAAITNQGTKAVSFFKNSKAELRRITWPTRPEAMQTTLIIFAVTIVVSLILWGLDSIIVSIIGFFTNLRF